MFCLNDDIDSGSYLLFLDNPANVSYEEICLPDDVSPYLLKYIPNIYYSQHNKPRYILLLGSIVSLFIPFRFLTCWIRIAMLNKGDLAHP